VQPKLMSELPTLDVNPRQPSTRSPAGKPLDLPLYPEKPAARMGQAVAAFDFTLVLPATVRRTPGMRPRKCPACSA
jgi:hypothetical protein